MEVVFSIITLIGILFAVFKGLKFISQTGRMSLRKEPPLTPQDLRVLEDTTARLMSDLQICTDECVDRIEKACEDAERRLLLLKGGIEPSNNVIPDINPTSPIAAEPVAAQVTAPLHTTAANDPSVVEIARESGLTTGEVELMKGLQSITRQ